MNMLEVKTVRPKKWSALIKPSLLLEVVSHTAMGVAVGLAFAFVVTHITALGIATLINYSPAPDAAMLMFVGTCTITFGIGATLTGLAITLTEDPDKAMRAKSERKSQARFKRARPSLAVNDGACRG
jgi:hypothetical protein